MPTWSIKSNCFDDHQTTRHHLLQYYIPCFTAKFVVSRCVFRKPRRNFGFFCSVSHLSGGGVNANHNTTRSPMPASPMPASPSKTKTENGSRLIENSKGNLGGEWNFCRGEGDRLFFILASKVDICKKDQKHVRAKLVNYCPNQDDHQQWTLKHRNKQNWSKSTNHKSQTMTFWTRSSTHLFPKRVPQRIWQLYRRKS